MYKGHLVEQLCPRSAHQDTEGFLSSLTPALTRPLCPQVLLFLQEKEEENHQASQVSCRGRAERRALAPLPLAVAAS